MVLLYLYNSLYNSETNNWYSDYVSFVSANYPWFNRGGNGNGGTSKAGVFGYAASGSNVGGALNGIGFRAVLSPIGA